MFRALLCGQHVGDSHWPAPAVLPAISCLRVCRQQQPQLELMLSHIPAESRPAVLNTLVDNNFCSLLHVAARRHDVQLLLGMVSYLS